LGNNTALLEPPIYIIPNPYNLAVDMVKEEDRDEPFMGRSSAFDEEKLELSVYSGYNDTLKYTLRVHNKGFRQADSVKVSYQLGACCLDFANYPTPTVGEVMLNNGKITWDFGSTSIYENDVYGLDLKVKPTRKGVTVDTLKIVSIRTGTDYDEDLPWWDEDESTMYDDKMMARIQVFYSIDSWTLPNMFSPNGDGINDEFIIRELENELFKDNEITIFNRYGVEVYHSKPYGSGSQGEKGWWKAEGLADGTYFYKLTIRLQNGNVENRGGYVTVRRQK
jgi:gliding motility-associated-like protein